MADSRTLSVEFPALAAEMKQRLTVCGETCLAEAVPTLRLVDRCRCGDDFCATMYTEPKPKSAYGPSHRNIDLDADVGWVILDVVEERIACVEVLYRDDIREKLIALFP